MRYLVKINDKKYEVEVEKITPIVETGMAAVPAEKEAPRKDRPEKPAASVPTGGEKVTAPIPGTILEVKVQNGQKVKKGQLLLILEAMKMENEILAVRDGVVEAISVVKGTSVNTGDLLLALA